MSDKLDKFDKYIESFVNSVLARSDAIFHATSVFNRQRKKPEMGKLAEQTKAELGKRYMAAVAKTTLRFSGDDLEDRCNLFIATVEIYGEGLATICADLPPPQDGRRDKVNQLAGALQRVQEIVTTMDSSALMQTLHEIERTLNDGHVPVTTDMGEAFISAGEVRELAGERLSKVIVAVSATAKRLDAPTYDPILEVIWRLEQLFDDHGLVFDVKDTGFAAECFRALWEQANPGKSKDRPKYLLKKAMEHPNSWANFKARMSKKLG